MATKRQSNGTIRQKLAMAKVFENNGNISKSMREAGYPRTTASNPQQLTNSKYWHDVMDKKLPNLHLLKKHREFLDTPRNVRSFKKGDLVTEIEETDPSAVKALDMAYKLKGFYVDSPDQTKPITINVQNFYGEQRDKHTISLQPTPIPTAIS